MVDVVKNNLDKIVDTCKQMRVKSLYLVGSGARVSDYSSRSDLDFLYSMKTENEEANENRFDSLDLLFKLEEITGKKVDLIAEERIRNKFLLRSLLEDRIKIYEA